VRKVDAMIESCSQRDIELHVSQVTEIHLLVVIFAVS